jgi:tRNA-dihydrouridine synthase A
MMDWTDRHCRSFHRALTRTAWLYTEMITSEAIAHGDRDRLLGRGEDGDRVVLQLGGNDPRSLAAAAAIGAEYDYAEINLNCGCPSDRVRDGAFGACLMAEPDRVADCVAAMIDAQPRPVTVKHRIGIDRRDDYDFVATFVARVGAAGCERFIVHARNAWLDGLSPKENRELPPLRPEVVHRLRSDFPGYAFELNGGLRSLDAARDLAAGLSGAMFGRAAYHDPWMLAGIDGERLERHEVACRMAAYLERHRGGGVRLRHLARHLLGLYQGQPGARRWRRTLSDPAVLDRDDPAVLVEASAVAARSGSAGLQAA